MMRRRNFGLGTLLALAGCSFRIDDLPSHGPGSGGPETRPPPPPAQTTAIFLTEPRGGSVLTLRSVRPDGTVTRVADASKQPGFNPFQVTGDPWRVALSPNAKWLAWHHSRIFDLYGPSATSAPAFTEPADYALPLAPWSRDGSRLAYSNDQGALRILSLSTLKPVEVATSVRADKIEWAPDGSRLSYYRYTDSCTGTELHTVNADGSDDRLIASSLTRIEPCGSDSWSADSQFIAYVVGVPLSVAASCTEPQSATAKFWIARADGSEQHLIAELPATDADYHDPFHRGSLGRCAWAPRADRILLGAEGGLYSMRETGADSQFISRAPTGTDPVHMDDFAWSATGDRLVLSTRDGQSFIAETMRPDQSYRKTRINIPDTGVSSLIFWTWSPAENVASVVSAYRGDPDEVLRQYLLDDDTDKMTLLSQSNVGTGTFSPDGKRLFYENGAQRSAVLVSTGESVAAPLDFLSWFGDGDHLLHGDKAGIEIQTFDGKAPIPVWKTTDTERLVAIWFPAPERGAAPVRVLDFDFDPADF